MMNTNTRTTRTLQLYLLASSFVSSCSGLHEVVVNGNTRLKNVSSSSRTSSIIRAEQEEGMQKKQITIIYT
jgi:hypothetical protein